MRPLGPILLAVVAASCAVRPEVAVRVAGEPARIVLASETRRTCNAATHGDAFPRDVPLTTVRATGQVTIEVAARPGATEFRGWIYDEESPTRLGGPVEDFTLAGGDGAYATRTIQAGRTYRVLVNARSDALLGGHEVTHILRFRVSP